MTFQSTPSAWRVTRRKTGHAGHDDISIHTLRVEGDQTAAQLEGIVSKISIHTLRVEGDGRHPRAGR